MTLAEIQKEKLLNTADWLACAEALLESAAQYVPMMQKYFASKGTEQQAYEKFLRTSLMLSAFAMENILKALIVQDQREALAAEFAEKQKLPSILQTHDLRKLAQRARLALGEDGTGEILDRLTRHSVWAGRYPVPLRPADLPAEDVLLLGGNWLPIAAYFTTDWKNVQTVYGRAKEILERRTNAPTTESNATSG